MARHRPRRFPPAALVLLAGAGLPTGGVGQEAPPAALCQSAAVVNMDLVLQKSSAAQSLQRQLGVQRERFEKEMVAQQDKLRAGEQALAQDRQSLETEIFHERRREFELQVAAARQSIEERTRTLDQAFDRARGTLLDVARTVVAEVAQDQGACLVIARQYVVYQSPAALDLTDLVVDRLNARLPEVQASLPQ